MTASSSSHTPLIKLTTCNTKWPLHSELQVHFSHDTPTLLFATAAAQKRLGARQSCPELFSTTRHNNCLVTCKTTIASRLIFAPACQQISKQLTFGRIRYVETENKFPTWWVTGGRMFEPISLGAREDVLIWQRLYHRTPSTAQQTTARVVHLVHVSWSTAFLAT